MFSLRSYRCLREEVDSNTGKSNCHETPGDSLRSERSSSSAASSAASAAGSTAKSSAAALHSIKAAWKSLNSSLSFASSSRLHHLQRAESTPDPTLEYRYTQFPTTANTIGVAPPPCGTHRYKRNNKDSPTHHRAPATPPVTLAQCLRRKKTKSKSENALQKIGIKLKSRSDQNLHRICFAKPQNHLPPSNAIFSNVHLSGGSGDSSGSSGGRFHRSRSLERNHCNRVNLGPHNTRSLERNHKFRLHLVGSFPPSFIPHSRDTPPSHPAPPPPVARNKTFASFDGSGGSLSICSSSSESSGESSLTRNSMDGAESFINKPPRGWLHPDHQLAEEGICYGVRYIGALDVNTSMKSLNFDTRSLIAKECISKVCEAAGLKTVDRRKKTVKSIGRILGEHPLMEHAGSNVSLTITSAALTLTTLETGQIVASHDMPNISFASGGDPDTLDFIAYVAKDNRYRRACFVLECGGGLAQDVITTIGQAFELRFKEYLKRTPTPVQYTNVKSDGSKAINEDVPWKKDDREYYNDLPGKVPPDLPPIPPLPQSSNNKSTNNSTTTNATSRLHSKSSTAENPSLQRVNENLIDLSSEELCNQQQAGTTMRHEPEYANDAVIRQRHDVKDPFDMQPFSMQLNQMGGSQTILGTTSKPLPLVQRLELQRETWFHGAISRKEAEVLLLKDGDFLVRESQGTSGQYVLTGIQNDIKKHLLLVDPEGVVRTKSRTFESVSHLINYHRDNELPIVSAESALVLRNPVLRQS